MVFAISDGGREAAEIDGLKEPVQAKSKGQGQRLTRPAKQAKSYIGSFFVCGMGGTVF